MCIWDNVCLLVGLVKGLLGHKPLSIVNDVFVLTNHGPTVIIRYAQALGSLTARHPILALPI
jgi:hypothetical protein